MKRRLASRPRKKNEWEKGYKRTRSIREIISARIMRRFFPSRWIAEKYCPRVVKISHLFVPFPRGARNAGNKLAEYVELQSSARVRIYCQVASLIISCQLQRTSDVTASRLSLYPCTFFFFNFIYLFSSGGKIYAGEISALLFRWSVKRTAEGVYMRFPIHYVYALARQSSFLFTRIFLYIQI